MVRGYGHGRRHGHEDPDLRAAAAAAYAACGGDLEEVTSFLVQCYTETSGGVDIYWSELARNGHLSVKVLVENLTASNPTLRMIAASSLGEMDAAETLPAIRDLLGDPNPAVVNMAEAAIARLAD